MAAAAASTSAIGELFKGVIFFVNDDLRPKARDALKTLLLNHGAAEASKPTADSSAARFDLDSVTHVVTGTLDFPEYSRLQKSRATDVGIVLPEWVTRSVDIERLQLPRYFSPSPAMIFAGLCVCCSELPETDMLSIEAGVQSFGGQWQRELTRQCTHLIVVAPSGPKYELARQRSAQLGLSIVLPQWFEQSLRLRHAAPTRDYAFPNPPLLDPSRWISGNFASEPSPASPTRDESNETVTFRILGPSRPSSMSYCKSAAEVLGQKGPPAAPVPAAVEPIFSDRSVYLSSDLGISEGLEVSLKTLIEQAGGKCYSWRMDCRVSGAPDQWEARRRAERLLATCNTVVTRRREGWEYWHAYEQKKTIGNLAWLYHVSATAKLESPLQHLLHYPPPPGQVPEFVGKTVTITNYVGTAREYVRTLLEILGAEHSGTLCKATDFVVAASNAGQKVKYAHNWDVPVVTHLWLDACFVEWARVPTTLHSDFIHLPAVGVNLASILGATPLPQNAIDSWAQREEVLQEKQRALQTIESAAENATQLQSAGSKESTGEEMDRGAAVLSHPAPPRSSAGGESSIKEAARSKPSAKRQREAAAPADSGRVADDSDGRSKRARVPVASPKASSDSRQHLPANVTPAGKQQPVVAQESAADSSAFPGRQSRAAALAASAKIAVQGPDALKFQQELLSEKKRRRGRTGSEDGTPRHSARSNSSPVPHDTSIAAAGPRPLAFKPPVSSSAMVSSFDAPPKPPKVAAAKPKAVRWMATGLLVDDHVENAMAKLGAKRTRKHEQVTHLVVKGLSRTMNFLCCLPYHPLVVTQEWLEACEKAGSLVDASSFQLNDPEKEHEYNISLETSLMRARQGKPLQGLVFHLTKSVEPSADTLAPIIEHNGGKVLIRQPKKRDLVDNPELLVISAPGDRRIWERAQWTNKSPRQPIFSGESIIQSALHQQPLFGQQSEHRIDLQLDRRAPADEDSGDR